MNKTRYVVRLQPQLAVVIDASACEENYNLSLSDWVKRIRSDDARVPFIYNFKWYHGENVNVDRLELYGRFIRETDATMSMNLCMPSYPVFYYTMEEFMKLFRIGKQGWCVSSVVNVL